MNNPRQDVVYVSKEEFEEEFNKLKEKALEFRDKLIEANKEKVKDKILISYLKKALEKINNELNKLKAKKGGKSKIVKSEDLLDGFLDILVDRYNVSNEEKKQYEAEATKTIEKIIGNNKYLL